MSKPQAKYRLQITAPPGVAPWLAWQAAIDNTSREEIIIQALRDFHAKRKAEDPKTPDFDVPTRAN